MRWLYSFLYTCAMVVALPFFVVLGVIRGKYLKSAGQRFGFIPQRSEGKSCWIHCVSVGEFLAAKPLIRRIQSEFPDASIYVSTTTATGQQLARAFLPDRTFYFPFDWTFSIRRVIERIQPALVIVLETEIWPNFLWECEARSIPVVLVNGRLSDKSFQRYSMFREWLPGFRESLMQTSTDAERMKSLSANPENVRVMGNLKFDFHPPSISAELKDVLQSWKGNSIVWIAGSTMPGEESQLLDAQISLAAKFPIKLVIAPRHPERFEEVASLISRAGLTATRRSRPASASADVFLLDTIGELAACYEFADLVFIGGTLSDHGGHNPIEPAYFGKPIIAGPHYSNFRSVFEEFRSRDAILITGNVSEGMRLLLETPEKRVAMGNASKSLLAAHAGATEVAMQTLRLYLESFKKR